MKATPVTKRRLFPKGAEWRRWDLHFHSPASYDYQNKSSKPAEIIESLVKAKIEALAVTDHHVIDKAIIEELRKHAGDRLTIYPSIELRTELGGSSLVHLIGIFPEDADIDQLWTKLSGGLNITPGDVQKKGDDRVYVDFRETAKLIHDLGGIVTVHAGQKKSNSIEGISNHELYKQQLKTDLLSECVDILEVGSPDDCEDYEKIVFPSIKIRLPICICSDNHDHRKYDGAHDLWIKADPTFKGLAQIIQEPTNRVFIGTVPPALTRVKDRPTRVIQSVKVQRRTDATTTEKWFNFTLPFNPELIAIIGNKGSGKSALSDILGLLGNTPRYENFSFLTDARFRDPRNNLAKQFEANITWADGSSDLPRLLSENPDTSAVERIKYIPQNYLEEICNEISSGKGSRFYEELEQVIFSHVSKADRLDCHSLQELLSRRTEEVNRSIEALTAELRQLNREVLARENQLLPGHRKSLEAQGTEKQRELEAFEKTKPKEVPKPQETDAVQQAARTLTEELEKKKAALGQVEKELKDLEEKDAKAAKDQATVDKLVERLASFQTRAARMVEEITLELESLGLVPNDIISFAVNLEPLRKRAEEIKAERGKTVKLRDATVEGSLEARRVALTQEITALQGKLAGPQREYQEYLEKLKLWEAGRGKIVGNAETPGTVEYLKSQLALLQTLPLELNRVSRQRNRKALEIYRQKQVLRRFYATYYGAVSDFLTKHPLGSSSHFRLTFNVAIEQNDFVGRFLALVNQRKFGPFAGLDEGTRTLNRLLGAVDFDSVYGARRFIRNLIEAMSSHEGRALQVREQLRRPESMADLYDLLFSFDYLTPTYKLKWDGKSLEQLSPGERGNLLLTFYLLVDQDDIPLVIDQPEENLDNQTVYRTLVPCIQDAKKRRQIILVTHNPNLAVVCDAEQVIYAEMHKEKGNEVTYLSGAIEDPIINEKIIDVLEGTRPAFDKRDAKYLDAPEKP